MENDSDCTTRCIFKEHGDAINSVIRADYQEDILKAYICKICNNPGRVRDSNGRTALHVAVIFRRTQLIPWLIKEANADINARDLASGYTPLHISIYKGFIDVTILLLKLGADTELLDKEFLNPFDILFEYPIAFPYDLRKHCDVSMYGTNNNFNLGIGNQQERSIPERHDFLYKHHGTYERMGDSDSGENATAFNSVERIYMNEFHTLFINNLHQAFSCGHGRGGRLGLGSEQTALTPMPLKISYKILSASISRYHTVLVSSTKQALSCGLNNYAQLGHNPPPSILTTPRVVRFEESVSILNVSAARCHTIFWSKDADAFFICGLNGGQFGIDSRIKSIVTPKKVKLSDLHIHTPHKIKSIQSSDGAVIIRNLYDDLYLLTNFECTKLISKNTFPGGPLRGPTGSVPFRFQLKIELIAIHGGNLKSSLLNENERLDDLIRVVIYLNDRKIYLWDNITKSFTRCFFTKWEPSITQLHLNNKEMLFIANDHAYSGNFVPAQKIKGGLSNLTSSENKFDKDKRFLEKSECIEITKRRLQYLYRPVFIISDPKGDNYGVLQKKAYNNIWSKLYIYRDYGYLEQMLNLYLNCKDDGYYDIILQIGGKKFFLHKYILASRSDYFAKLFETNHDSVIIINMDLTPFEIGVFETLLIYAYIRVLCLDSLRCCYLEYFNAHSYPTLNEFLINQKYHNLDDLEDVADRFEIRIDPQDTRVLYQNNPFNREDFKNLWDIKLRSSDGAIFNAHKCILVGKNEYFKTWLKYDCDDILDTKFTSSEIKLFLEFIYGETFSNETKLKTSTESFCDLLVISDFVTDSYLKNTCSIILIHSITINNFKTLYELSKIYSIDNLRNCILEFILNNILECLEKRILEEICEDFMEEINDYYQENCSYLIMSRESESYIDPCRKLLDDNTGTVKKEKDKRRRRRNHSFSSRQDQIQPSFVNNQSSDCPITKSTTTPNQPASSSLPNQNFISMSEFPDLVKSMEKSPTQIGVSKDKPKHTPIKSVKFANLKTHSFFENSSGFLSISINKLLSNDVPKALASTSHSNKKSNPWGKIDFNPWGKIDSNVSKQETPTNNFSDIVLNEQKKKTNFNKMKTKPLHLTQLEDKAIYELLQFYNAPNSYDENISVFRGNNEPMSLPEWVDQNNKHKL